VLEFAEYGDPDGLPVVLQPGTPATCDAGALVDEAAWRHGVRVLSVSRPGYGSSPATPPGLASVAQQVLVFADELGLERFGIWGLSGGGPYALAQGLVTPGHVTRVVVSAGVGPGLPVQDVTELTSEANDVSAHFAGLDAEALVAQVPPHERFFRDHPELASAFVADTRRALEQPDGYVRDNLSWAGEWDLPWQSMTVPVDLVYGEADQMVTADHGRRLAELLPGATLTVLPGAGHGYSTFGSADLVLGMLGSGE
jgi:pimeloyl-ACP methyl ester carboxylesterase